MHALFDGKRDEQFWQENHQAIGTTQLTGSPRVAQNRALDTWRGLIAALGERTDSNKLFTVYVPLKKKGGKDRVLRHPVFNSVTSNQDP